MNDILFTGRLAAAPRAELRLAALRGATLVYTRREGDIPAYRDLDEVRFPQQWELCRGRAGGYQVAQVQYSLDGDWVPGGYIEPPEYPCFEWAGYDQEVICPTFAAAWRELQRQAGP